MTDERIFDTSIADFIAQHGMPMRIITGGCKTGADALAKRWASTHAIPLKEHAPDWLKHGKAAGPMRDPDLVNEATHVLAFPHPKGKGTQNAIRLARKMGKPVMVFELGPTTLQTKLKLK